MEVLILKRFRDKNTHRVYEPGETVTLTKKRVTEITKKLGEGFITEAPADDPNTTPTE